MLYLEEIFDATKELVLQLAQELSGEVELKPVREEAGTLYCVALCPDASAAGFGMLQRLRGRLEGIEALGTFPVKLVTETRIDFDLDHQKVGLEMAISDRNP